MSVASAPRPRLRRRRSTLLRMLELLSDDQVLLCSCDERHLACAG